MPVNLSSISAFVQWNNIRGMSSSRYLHGICSPSVIHKNMKSASILLDAELNPHLSDCGVAVFYEVSKNHWSTTLWGHSSYSQTVTLTLHPTASGYKWELGAWIQCSWMYKTICLYNEERCLQLRGGHARAIDRSQAFWQVMKEIS